jgi:hypothetical protein
MCCHFFPASYGGECEDPYPSLSDFHDYEPNLEFDDSDLLQHKHPEIDDGEMRFPFFVERCSAIERSLNPPPPQKGRNDLYL